jgi:hypothetical protein
MNKRFRIAIVVILALLVIISAVWAFHKKFTRSPDQASVTIVLSPHFGDAALSLGGLMAEDSREQVIATFFTGAPALATTTEWDADSGFADSSAAVAAGTAENATAATLLGATVKNYDYVEAQYGHGESDTELESDIAQDIQALIASFNGKSVYVYGPSIFTPDTTDPDQAILYDAFVDVATDYPTTAVHFFFYEDYPYINDFNGASTQSVEQTDENDSQLLLDRVDTPLTKSDVIKKAKAINDYPSLVEGFSKMNVDVVQSDEQYTNSRCGAGSACEATYEVMQ